MFSEDSWTCLPLLIFHLDEHLNACVTLQECGSYFTSVNTLPCLVCQCLPLHSPSLQVFCRVDFRPSSTRYIHKNPNFLLIILLCKFVPFSQPDYRHDFFPLVFVCLIFRKISICV